MKNKFYYQLVRCDNWGKCETVSKISGKILLKSLTRDFWEKKRRQKQRSLANLPTNCVNTA